MANLAIEGTGPASRAQTSRAAALSRLRFVDAMFAGLTRAAAITVLVLLGGGHRIAG